MNLIEETKQEYVCGLSPRFVEMAREQLGEDKAKRNHSLALFREILAKHPIIKKCRTDSIFLLRFLRARKFSVLAACDMLEKVLMHRHLASNFFKLSDILDPRMSSLLDTGYYLPLIEKDHLGRQIIIFDVSKFDVNKFISTDVFRLNNLVMAYYLKQEECQVAGFVFLFIGTNITMKYISLFSPTDLKVFYGKVPQIKIKQVYLVNFPTIANSFLQICMTLISEKLRKRMLVYKDMKLLETSEYSKILPKEFGGTIPIKDMIADIKEKLLSYREEILADDDFAIDVKSSMSWSTSCVESVCGSFRKLEVD